MAPAARRVRRRTPVLLELGIATMIVTPGEAVPEQASSGPVCARSASWRCRKRRPAVVSSGGDGARDALFPVLGTLSRAKTFAALVEAVARSAAASPRRPGAGRAAGAPRFPLSGGKPGLRIVGEVADEKLPQLYSGALAFVYPSLYEGFGLAGTGGHAVRRLRDCLARRGGSGRRPRSTPTPQEWREPCAKRRGAGVEASLRARSLAAPESFPGRGRPRPDSPGLREARRRFGR